MRRGVTIRPAALLLGAALLLPALPVDAEPDGGGADSGNSSDSADSADSGDAVTLATAAGNAAMLAGSGRFEDVAAGSVFDASIGWLVEQRITTGVTATRFEPGADIRRDQMATFLWRMAGQPQPQPQPQPEAEPEQEGEGARFVDVLADSTHATGIA